MGYCAVDNAGMSLSEGISLMAGSFARMNVACAGGMRIVTALHQRLRVLRFAQIATRHFVAISGNIGNIAAMHAISRTDLARETHMTKEQYERERRYRVAVSVAVTMLKKGLICEDEYRIINERMIDKYNPLFGGLVR